MCLLQDQGRCIFDFSHSLRCAQLSLRGKIHIIGPVATVQYERTFVLLMGGIAERPNSMCQYPSPHHASHKNMESQDPSNEFENKHAFSIRAAFKRYGEVTSTTQIGGLEELGPLVRPPRNGEIGFVLFSFLFCASMRVVRVVRPGEAKLLGRITIGVLIVGPSGCEYPGVLVGVFSLIFYAQAHGVARGVCSLLKARALISRTSKHIIG